MTRLGKIPEMSASALKEEALQIACNNDRRGAATKTINNNNNGVMEHIDGLITVPSLSEPLFLDAHHLSSRIGILPCSGGKGAVVRTIDTGGAGPVSALLQADRMIKYEGCSLVAVVAGDAVASMHSKLFLERADDSCKPSYGRTDGSDAPMSPIIPSGYNRVAEWYISQGAVTREQLAMVSVLMSRQAARHPLAMTKRPHTLEAVLHAPPVASVTGLLECARRADGAAAVLVASDEFIRQHRHLFDGGGRDVDNAPVILGGGEASGPLYPPAHITEDMFSCAKAVSKAYAGASLGVSDMDYFGLYDCFPICFVRALEGVGLAPPQGGGRLVQQWYDDAQAVLPVNTHGGLLGQGAPWEAPALFSVCEAVAQLTGTAGDRQLAGRGGREGGVRHALVYGNGGVFSASAAVVLGRRPLQA